MYHFLATPSILFNFSVIFCYVLAWVNFFNDCSFIMYLFSNTLLNIWRNKGSWSPKSILIGSFISQINMICLIWLWNPLFSPFFIAMFEVSPWSKVNKNNMRNKNYFVLNILKCFQGKNTHRSISLSFKQISLHFPNDVYWNIQKFWKSQRD